MSDSYTPFVEPTQQPQTQQAPQNDLAGQWRAFLAKPENTAALMQTGLNLMQPQGIGQTAAGQVAQAIGGGGEAAGRVLDNQIKEDAAETKAETARQRADASTTRAEAATMRAHSDAAQVNSRITLRAAQESAALARKTNLDTQVELLEKRISLYGEDHESRIQLRALQGERERAKAEYDRARTAGVPIDTETRRMRAETGQDLVGVQQQRADTQSTRVSNQKELGDRRVRVAEQRAGTQHAAAGSQAALREQAEYRKWVEGIQKGNDSFLRDPKKPKDPIPSIQEWREKFRTQRPQQQAPQQQVPNPQQNAPRNASGDPLEGKTGTTPDGVRWIRRGGEWVVNE